MKVGANYTGNGRCEFVVWAPLSKEVEVRLVSSGVSLASMDKDDTGYWKAIVEDILPDTRYFYRLDNDRERPDPASHFQPDGVHGSSRVVYHGSFKWEDNCWKGIPLPEMIMYELHAGTFTPEGTFDAVIPRLKELKELGVNAIEIMPVAQFPGGRNWGYDGVYPFAVQNSYGGPDGLKRLVNECHKTGIAVILDVVYNHLGPEGNYIWDFAPYFTDRYKTPWGWAINFDGPYSNEVRNYFIENALYWFKEYHIDALRLDAIHGITDMSATPFLRELADSVRRFSEHEGRHFYLIAESDLNDSRVIRPGEVGGFGMDAQWCDDFHHSLRTLVSGDKDGYYIDFGRVGQLAKSLKEGYVYSGEYSLFRKRNHGNSSKDLPAGRFVVFSQNHDQVGNRMLGERLAPLIPFEALKLAAGMVILSPYIPLLFMGEEYGEDAPFLYFVSHSDPELIEAVRKGRREEFSAFAWKGEAPDPQSEDTYLRSKIEWGKRESGRHKTMLSFYKRLIRMRQKVPAFSSLDRGCLSVCGLERDEIIFMERWKDACRVFCIFNLNDKDIKAPELPIEGEWRRLLDSSEAMWGGPGSALPETIGRSREMIVKGKSFAVYIKEALK